MNNIYAKIVLKEYSTLHELHPITLARGIEGTLISPPTGFSFNSIFIDKKVHFVGFIDLNY